MGMHVQARLEARQADLDLSFECQHDDAVTVLSHDDIKDCGLWKDIAGGTDYTLNWDTDNSKWQLKDTTVAQNVKLETKDPATNGVYDLYATEGEYTVADFQVTLACNEEAEWITTSGKFCSRENQAARYNDEPDVVKHQCHNKCVDKIENVRAVDGTLNWCGGNALSLDDDANALCLPRERCEEAGHDCQ